MAWVLSLVLLLVRQLHALPPDADVEFVFTKKYQVDENSHFIWDTKYQTQAKMGSRSLHWGMGTLLPYDSGVSLKTGSAEGREYQDMVAFAPIEGLERWPKLSLAGKNSGNYWAVAFWLRGNTESRTTILTKHGRYKEVSTTAHRNEGLAINYVRGTTTTQIEVRASVSSGAGAWESNRLSCGGTVTNTATGTDWNHIVVRFDTSGTGTELKCVVNGVEDGVSQTLLSSKWKDFTDEPLYLRSIGVSGDTAALWVYSVAFYQSGVSDLSVFSAADIQDCGVSTSVSFSCSYCPIGKRSCLFSCKENQYDNNGVCMDCIEGCASCNAAGTCLQCKVGYYLAADSQSCAQCDGRCAHCWGPRNSQCYACRTSALDTVDRPSSTWMVANNTCEGQASLLLTGTTTFWPEPVSLQIAADVAEFSEFSVDFWVRLDTAYDDSVNDDIIPVIDFGRHFFYVHTTTTQLRFEDFKTRQRKALGAFSNKNWVLAAYAMNKFANRNAYVSAKTGPADNFIYADPTGTPLEYAAPSMVLLNGHHSYSFRRAKCGFNNLRIWSKFRPMVEVLNDMRLYYTPQSAPPHLLVNYPVLAADKSFLVNSVLHDPAATVINWAQSPFEFKDAGNATTVLPGNPSSYYTQASANLRGDYSPDSSYHDISICPFTQKSPQPALFSTSALCRDELHFVFNKKTVSQLAYDSLNYKHIRMGLEYGVDSKDPALSVDTNGAINDAGLVFTSSLMMLPPIPPEETVPALQIRTSMTFEAWIKPKTLTTAVAEDTTFAVPTEASTVFSMRTQEAFVTRALFIKKVGDKHYLSYFARGMYGSMLTKASSVDFTDAMTVDKWVHVAVVVNLYRSDANIVTGFMDGKSIKSQVQTDTTTPFFAKDLMMEPYSTPVIGAMFQFGRWGGFYQGGLFAFDLYNYARSQSEIAQGVLRAESATGCSSVPSWLQHCPALSDMVGSVPACVAPCSTCTDGKPTECRSCATGFYLDSAKCVTFCSSGKHANKSTNLCESVTALADFTGATAVFDGKTVAVTFKSALDFTGGCAESFAQGTRTKLGESFNCKWSTDHTVLTVRLGSRASVLAGDILTFANNALTQFSTSTHLLSSMSLPAVVNSATLPSLRPSIAITQLDLSKCQDILFTALGSEGTRLQFAWEFYVFPLDKARGKAPPQYGAFAAQNFEARLPQGFFAEADSLQAVLFIKDAFGQVSQTSYTYALSYSEIPTAYFPYGNYNFNVYRGVEYNFPVSVVETHCAGHTNKPTRTLSVKWTLDTTSSNTLTTGTTSGVISAANEHNLRLGKYSMEIGKRYTYNAVVGDDTFSVTSSFNTTVTVVARALVPVIQNGDRWHTYNQELILDAVRSYDPETGTNDGIEYCWSVACNYGGKDATTTCFKKTTSLCPPSNTKTTLELTNEDFYADGTYKITLTIKKDTRSSTLTTTINTKTPMIPEVTLDPVPTKFPTTQDLMLYGDVKNLDRLETVPVKTAFLNNNEETVTYWRVSPTVKGLFASPEFAYATVARGFDPWLTGTYTVTLTVEDLLSSKGTNYKGKAWITAAANSPPKAGIVYLTPSWSVPAFSDVQISVEGVWDDDLPLSYEFYRSSPTASLQIGTRYNYGLLGQIMVPLSPAPVYHVVRVYDFLGDYSEMQVSFVAPMRPTQGDPAGWFSTANQKIQTYLAYDPDVAFSNALTYAESLAIAVNTGLLDARSPAFSGLVGAFMTVFGSSSLAETCRTAGLKLQILKTVGDYAENLSEDVLSTVKSQLEAFVTASSACIPKSEYSTLFQLYASLGLNAAALPAIFSPGAVLGTELRIDAGDSQILIKRDQFQHFYPDAVTGVYASAPGVDIAVAPGAFALKETECIDTRAVVYAYNPVDGTESISTLVDVSFAKSCVYETGKESTFLSPPTDLTLAAGTNVTLTLQAEIDPRYFTRAVCMVYDDTAGWTANLCVFEDADVAGGTVTCTCSQLGLIAAFIEQTQPLVDSRAFQKPAVNLFDFTTNDLRYGPQSKDDGKYYMDRMNPNYIQLIFFFLYIVGAFVLVRMDDKDMTVKCRRVEEPVYRYLVKEHVFLAIFLSPYRTSLVTRVSRAYIFVTVTHCILALGGLFYFNDVEDVRENAWDDYTNKDYLVAVYLAHIGMLMSFILKGLFNPRVVSDRLVGYTVATAFNILFFIMCVWYTANLTENPTNHWLLSWFLGWITYICILDFLLTLVVIAVLDCFCIPMGRLLQDSPPASRQEIVPPHEPADPGEDEPLAPNWPGVGEAGGDLDNPENPPSTRR